MTRLKNRRFRLLVILLLILLGLAAITGSAQAQDLVAGESIPAGTTFDNDAFLSGDNVVIDGTVNGDVLAVGRRVTINGQVTGSLVAAAEVVNVNGDVGGSVYAAAATLEANEAAAVDRSLYFIGAQLNTDPASQVDRDLVAAALGAQLAGNVGRDVKVVVGPLALIERVFDLLNIETGFQILPSSALAPENQPPDVASRPVGDQRWSVLASPARAQNDSPNQAQTTGEWFLIRLRQMAQFLIVGGLVSWLFPVNFSRWSDSLRRRPMASGLYGFVGFVTGFAGVFLLTLLVLVIGIGLAILTLRGLAITTWGLGFSTTALLFAIFMVFLLFISKVIVSYVTGLIILERLLPRAANHRFWPMLLGLIIYVLLRAIPYLGLGIGFLVTIFGLGAAMLALASRDKLAWRLAEEEE
ncbi:MAG TPA: polymer-forming cytoskeletal protein [Anaerolineae bacterium]|nr:polymer-forming cytoskeletal protein [Anaerolineae bacterium]